MYRLSEVMEPLWCGTKVNQESVIFLERDQYTARLLYPCKGIIKIESSDQKITYSEGKDYIVQGDTIHLTKESSIPKITEEELYPEMYMEKGVFGCIHGGYLRFGEGFFWHKQQVWVTYEAEEKNIAIPLPESSTRLSNTVQKIKKGEELRLVVYGDSISQGYNASGFVGAEPYMPSYGELICQYIRENGCPVWMKNTALGGKDSIWGLEHVRENVCVYKPDLVILAFGMNDGTARLDPKEFQNNIKEMRRIISESNESCEFLCVAPMLPNKEACLLNDERTPFFGNQERYLEYLLELRQKGTDVLDMTSIHKALLKRKKFLDMSGNNINHPNDYLIRWYAQAACKLLGIMDKPTI